MREKYLAALGLFMGRALSFCEDDAKIKPTPHCGQQEIGLIVYNAFVSYETP